jgi:ribosome-associated protein
LNEHQEARGESIAAAETRPDAEGIVRTVIDVAEEKKAHDVVALDVRGLTIVTDFFVIASADNQTAVRSLSKRIIERLLQGGVRALHVEGAAVGGWLLLDYGDAVVHIFLDEARFFYDLEGLWGDAPRYEG